MEMPSALRVFDETLFRLINQRLANPIGDFLCPLINQAAPFLPLLVLLLLWLAFRNRPRHWIIALTCILTLTATDALISNPLKKSIQRPRPAATLYEVRELAPGATGGNSFPSSHTTNAFLVATLLSACFPRQKNFLLFFGLAAWIAFCRIYVGVHYPSDVLGSALLGMLSGSIAILIFSQLERRLVPVISPPTRPQPSTRGLLTLEDSSHTQSKRRGSKAVSHASSPSPSLIIIPAACLALLQVLRLLWTQFNHLDVPLECVRLWYAVHVAPETAGFWIRFPAKAFFTIFGNSSFSLWMMPWIVQTAFFGLLAWLVFRNSGATGLKGLLLLLTVLPLISQLSFLGSPMQIFGNSDWPASMTHIAWVFYLTLGLPLWIYALGTLRRTPWPSISTLSGLILAVGCPQLSWFIPSLLATGTLVQLAGTLGQALTRFQTPSAGWTRVGLVSLLLYGLVFTLAVYNPRFLRKLNISMLPRNSPHYLQTGWKDLVRRNRAKITGPAEIWTDAESSKHMIRWMLGDSFHVLGPDEWAHASSSGNVFYIREVDFAQIHPRVIFVPRNPREPKEPRRNWLEIDSFEVVRQGDPIRQFQIFCLPPKAEPAL